MRKAILFGIDLLIYTILFWGITVIELGGNRIGGNEAIVIRLQLFILFVVIIFLFRVFFKVYKNIWRYAGVGTYLKLIIADALAGMTSVAAELLFAGLRDSLYFTACIFSLCCMGSLAARFCYQFFYARHNARIYSPDEQSHKINIAIVGAGNIGASLAEELVRNPQSHYKPLCFIDIDPKKTGLSLNGLPVFEENEGIIDKIKKLPIHEIIIALPDKEGSDKEHLFHLYSKTGCKVKLYDYPVHKEIQSVQHYMRDLRIEDLLSRESIKMDCSVSKKYYYRKTVLITGGGGSIGAELCIQIAEMKPEKLIIFDIYENNAYEIQQELLRIYGDELNLEVLIGSVRDRKRLEEVFSMFKPEIVIHAAAHKHVPLMENSAAEAVKNNVFGTYYVANIAEKYYAEKFVLISTDKAVNPTSIMGASKRLCEMIVQCRGDSKTEFVAVRFGNVLGSNGSVIPLFQRQIETGGPITITDRRIIRYFMTITEAVQLVLEAGAMAQKGELYVLDMGKPVKIYDLALNMIKLSGLRLNKDIEIKEIGLRPGEKLYEELLIQSEDLYSTSNSKIFIEKDKPLSRLEVERKLMILRGALSRGKGDAGSIKEALHRCIREFAKPSFYNSKVMIRKSEEKKYAN